MKNLLENNLIQGLNGDDNILQWKASKNWIYFLAVKFVVTAKMARSFKLVNRVNSNIDISLHL